MTTEVGKDITAEGYFSSRAPQLALKYTGWPDMFTSVSGLNGGNTMALPNMLSLKTTSDAVSNSRRQPTVAGR